MNLKLERHFVRESIGVHRTRSIYPKGALSVALLHEQY